MKRIVLLLVSLPTALLLATLLALCDALSGASRPWRRGRRSSLHPPETAGAEQAPGVSIIVLNWNGRPLLEESLPVLDAALHRTSVPHEVIVVDNGSSDDSVDFVRRDFPHFRLLELPENLGFGDGNNAGVHSARYNLVLLLNNDMLVQPGFLEPLVEAMGSETFAVSSQVFFPPQVRREETGRTAARFRHGRLEPSHQEITSADEGNGVVHVLWAGGGASLYRKSLFLALGGFDTLYSPSYAEDADLSFRAWQAGSPSVLAVGSHVTHKHRSSTRKRFGESGAQRLMHRNILLFFLKNFSLMTLWRYLCWLPANSWANGEVAVLARTLPRWPLLLLRRFARSRPIWSEQEIFQRAQTPVRQAPRPARSQQPASPAPRPLRILYVSAYVPHLWRHGGAGRVFQLMQRVARTHQVSVAAFYENDFELSECDKLRSFCHSVTPVHRRGKPARNIFPYEPFEEFDLPEMREALERLACRIPFDIVHFEYTQMAQYRHLFPGAIAFLTEIEVNYGAAASRIAQISNPLRRFKWYYNSLQVLQRELELCRRVDQVVCVNETDADLLRGYLPAAGVHVVHTGVDLNYFTPNGDGAEEPFSIGFVGAFRHDPNVDGALFFVHKVLPLVKKQIPTAHFYLIGSAPPEEVQRLHNGTDITVTGFVDDLLRYYRRMSVIVVPLRTGVGIRGKILEAWAAGKPVVGTALAAAGIEACQGENMYIADEPEELARWIVRLLESFEGRKRLVLRGRQTAERFYDWDRLAERLCGLYEGTAVGEGGRRISNGEFRMSNAGQAGPSANGISNGEFRRRGSGRAGDVGTRGTSGTRGRSDAGIEELGD